jgi:hypothetical protein
MQKLTHYRLYNHEKGGVLYLLSIDSEVDHQERLEKKKTEIAYKYNIPHEDLSWEPLYS